MRVEQNSGHWKNLCLVFCCGVLLAELLHLLPDRSRQINAGVEIKLLLSATEAISFDEMSLSVVVGEDAAAFDESHFCHFGIAHRALLLVLFYFSGQRICGHSANPHLKEPRCGAPGLLF